MFRTMSDSDNESLGLNLSPDALFEAQRKSQQFSFVPQECDSIRGLFPTNYDGQGASNNSISSYPNHDDNCIDSMTFVHFCPPGPLGLIIDTTTRGPMIHSVKPTSILYGVMKPRDMIIGLDDKDTRVMTAPLITSLMASKSQQLQRKLTILRFHWSQGFLCLHLTDNLI